MHVLNDRDESLQLMLKFSLTADQFDRAAELTRMKETGVKIARLVIVENNGIKLTLAEAAKQFGKSKQYAAECVKRIMQSYLKSEGLPDDWEYVCLRLPKEKSELVKQMEQEELNKLFKDKGAEI